MIVDFVITLFATITADILWAFYIRRIAQGKALSAGVFAGMVYGNTVFITILYTQNHWLGIAVVIGSVIGTYIAVKLDTRKKDKKQCEE